MLGCRFSFEAHAKKTDKRNHLSALKNDKVPLDADRYVLTNA